MQNQQKQSDVDSKYADFSGIPMPDSKSSNPYDALIAAANHDPAQIQARYETHRRARNEQQKAKLLDVSFKGADIDEILYKLLHKDEYPDFEDPRYCLVFWSRPPESVRRLIFTVQQKLLEVLPNLWLMPPENLHMTSMEIAFSRTKPEIDALVDRLLPHLEEVTDYPFHHRTRLVRPMLGFDASAFALSFVPAAVSRSDHGDAAYTYHHLRRDLFDRCRQAGVEVGSRYVVPTAHLTVGRFVTQADISRDPEGASGPDPQKKETLIALIESINAWLQENYWYEDNEIHTDGSEWLVGQERGLDCGKGTLWYGNAERVRQGKGY